MHGRQLTALAGSPPPVVAATAPSRRHTDTHQEGATIAMDFFVDPASGWTCWIPRWPAEAEPRADEDRTAALRRRAGHGLVVRLLGRVGVWFGICEQTPSGAWRRIYIPRPDPWGPGARHNHSTIWSWWW
jgi:hypothetical protein